MPPEPSDAQAGTVQEPGQEQVPPASLGEPAGTTAPPASETTPPIAGEQPVVDALRPPAPSAAPAASEIGEEERIRRGVQSGLDKAQRRWEAQQLQRLEQQALQRQMQSMTPEELGQMMKDNQRMEPIVQQRIQAQRTQDFSGLVQGMIEPIADPTTKAELAESAYSNPSWEDFFGKVLQARVEQELAKERPKLRRQVQDAHAKEQSAAQAAAGPQLGAGLLVSHRSLEDMSTDEKLSAGLAELWGS